MCYLLYYAEKAPDNQAKTDSQEFSYDQPDVFDRLFDRYYTSLWSFAFHYVKDKDIAEDLVQEAFIQLWDHLKGFDSFAAIRVYLSGMSGMQHLIISGTTKYETGIVQNSMYGYKMN